MVFSIPQIRTSTWLLITLVAVLITSLTGWIGIYGLQGEEPRRALVSIEMLKTGEYIVPHMFGWVYYNKPPFFNWIMVLVFKITGSYAEWAVRLPSLLAMLLLAFINWRVVRKYVGPEAGILSSLFFVTSADIYYYATLYSGEIDLLFSLVVYLQAMVFFILMQRQQYLPMFLASYLFGAIAFLTKGLPGIAFQATLVVATLLVFRKPRLLFSWKHLSGIVLMCGILAGYIYLLMLEGQEFGFIIRQFKEASQRSFLESTVVDTLRGFLFFPVKTWYSFLPWTLFALLMFTRNLRNRITENNLILFASVFVLVNIPIYWITGDLKGRYIYPFLPFIFIVLAHFAVGGSMQAPKIYPWIDKIFGLFFILAPLALTFSLFIREFREAGMNWLFQSLLIAGSVALAFLFYRTTFNRNYLLVFLLIVIRFGMNNSYILTLRENSNSADYKHHVTEMLAIAGDREIMLGGIPNVYESSSTLGPIHLNSDPIRTAPYIAFQVPYYLTFSTNKLVVYRDFLEPGQLYLITEVFASGKNLEKLYQFHDNFIHQDWLLVKVPE